ncbi:response regulator [Paucibacter sp. APW11]|uniref:Response regulator n=1 Tax=Roseateles aquae TaxID=3077235 RepID=A0ABU3PBM6_9BURK|nr:response regulator [Paucibacter sp. APW11]MDT8999972.1 response regulator [Paucibacter sp. APW11]
MSRKVLIVEDQPELRALLRMTLEDEAFELVEAADAEAAWAEVQQQGPDIVLLDIMMPGAFDGLELCRRIKADARLQRCKVVLVSARGHRHDLEIGRQVGADDYLIKPFSPQRLLEVMHGLLSVSAT